MKNAGPLVVMLLLGILSGFLVGATFYDPFLQRNFPCQEDEVLMFINTAGNDQTGCMNIESVR